MTDTEKLKRLEKIVRVKGLFCGEECKICENSRTPRCNFCGIGEPCAFKYNGEKLK